MQHRRRFATILLTAGCAVGILSLMPTAQVIDPPDGKIPWQQWDHEKKSYIRENPYETQEFIDSRVRCLPAGTRLTLSSAYNGWQILQTPGHVIVFQEHNHNYRIIPLG